MFVVGCELNLRSDDALTGDQVTDLIESFVDELDALGVNPDVSTTGTGHALAMVVEVETQESDEFDAFMAGFSAIKAALHCAGVHTGRMVYPFDLRPMAPRITQDA